MARRWILPPAFTPAVVVGVLGVFGVLGGVWWWAVLRLVLVPEHTGVVEGAVAAGGWGLSLLPVHAAASRGKRGRAGRRGRAPADRHGVGPDWQRGHQ